MANKKPSPVGKGDREAVDEASRKAVFFDRDGTLNVDIHYLHRPEDFIWIPGAKEAIRYVNDCGYLAILVTNQSGVARGYYPESDVRRVYDWMNCELDVYKRQGMVLVESGAVHEIPVSDKSEVFDVSGAGDTCVATVILALAAGAEPALAARLSNIASGIAVRKLGTSTVSVRELAEAVEKQHPEYPSK